MSHNQRIRAWTNWPKFYRIFESIFLILNMRVLIPVSLDLIHKGPVVGMQHRLEPVWRQTITRTNAQDLASTVHNQIRRKQCDNRENNSPDVLYILAW